LFLNIIKGNQTTFSQASRHETERGKKVCLLYILAQSLLEAMVKKPYVSDTQENFHFFVRRSNCKMFPELAILNIPLKGKQARQRYALCEGTSCHFRSTRE
jgi:hypothetical protein